MRPSNVFLVRVHHAFFLVEKHKGVQLYEFYASSYNLLSIPIILPKSEYNITKIKSDLLVVFDTTLHN
jgi:hypothetical protein